MRSNLRKHVTEIEKNGAIQILQNMTKSHVLVLSCQKLGVVVRFDEEGVRTRRLRAQRISIKCAIPRRTRKRMHRSDQKSLRIQLQHCAQLRESASCDRIPFTRASLPPPRGRPPGVRQRVKSPPAIRADNVCPCPVGVGVSPAAWVLGAAQKRGSPRHPAKAMVGIRAGSGPPGHLPNLGSGHDEANDAFRDRRTSGVP